MNSIETNPFLYYNNQLISLFAKAGKQKNPGLWLFKNNIRTPLFMLEALTRLHSRAFDEKLFNKWNTRFKKLEDIVGIIDYFAADEASFKNNKTISKKNLSYFTANKNKAIKKLNKQVLKKEWLKTKLIQFNGAIETRTLVYNDDLLNDLKKSIVAEIQDIKLFCETKNYSFLLLEKEVHEIRRKLRWISMYAQALNGFIQLKKTPTKKYSTNYFTKKIIESPYNKLTLRPINSSVIEFDANAFLALSWVINELGILKDKGLEIEALTLALFETENITEYQAKEKALYSLGLDSHKEEDILQKASDVVHTFIAKDKLLDKLVV